MWPMIRMWYWNQQTLSIVWVISATSVRPTTTFLALVVVHNCIACSHVTLFHSNYIANSVRASNKNKNNNNNYYYWLQSSLPVGNEGLGIQGAQMLAVSAAASTLRLQQLILPDSTSVLRDKSIHSIEVKLTPCKQDPHRTSRTYSLRTLITIHYQE